MKKLLIPLLMLTAPAMAHTQSPGQIDDTVYTEVNTYEFTVGNRNQYATAFELLVYDAERIDGTIVKDQNFRVLGTIQELTPNETFQFRIDLRARTNDLTHKVVCTRMIREAGYRSEVCSLVTMKRF
jgi:hypothetical protein